MKRRIALALSGGSAYGSAHLGVLAVLEDAEIEVAGIAGTSVGALIGALYAYGVPLPELLRLARGVSWTEITRPVRPRLGLLSLGKLREWLRERIGEVDLRDAPIPLRIVATDLAAGEAVVFEEGPADEAVAASCAVPGIFEPLLREGRLLVDGGLVDNLPVRLARSLGVGPVVASDLLAPGSHPMPGNLLEVVLRATNMMVGASSAPQREMADVLVSPQLSAYSTADLTQSVELIRAGRQAARRALQAAGWI